MVGGGIRRGHLDVDQPSRFRQSTVFTEREERRNTVFQYMPAPQEIETLFWKVHKILIEFSNIKSFFAADFIIRAECDPGRIYAQPPEVLERYTLSASDIQHFVAGPKKSFLPQ